MSGGGYGAFSRAVLASASLSLAIVASGTQAQVVISKDPTSNMNCSPGVCSGAASHAVLNVKDLKKALAQGNFTVEGGAASSIEVETAVTWTKPSTLELQGTSIAVADTVKATGNGNLTIDTGSDSLGPTLTFPGKGSVTFLSTTSSVTINGTTYHLESSLASLAADIAANQFGNFALANDYDASADGLYKHSAVPAIFDGVFEGLGHTVTKLKIKASKRVDYVGLFAQLNPDGRVRDIKLDNVNIASGGDGIVGGVVGDNQGIIRNAFVSGRVGSGKEFETGGVAGFTSGTISQSMSTANVSGNSAGGVVGEIAGGSVENSFATGAVLGTAGDNQPVAGGLVGFTSPGTIKFSYSTGNASGSAVSGGSIGDCFMTSATDVYWDLTTSGNTLGCGSGSASVTGLTNAQLQSGLPAGFDASIWSESAGVNNGLPYLLALGPN